MCRMVGVVFRGEFPITTLTDLRRLSKVGKIPDEKERGHRDGWGIASFNGGRPYYIGRSTRPAYRDPTYNEAVAAIMRLERPNMLIAHVRAAFSGGIALENTHPFLADGLIFAHNGTVTGFRADGCGRAKGQTDSELISLLVADRLKEKGALFSAMKSVVREEIDGHEFTGAVFLASDGRSLTGYRDYSVADRAGYYSLEMAKCRDYVALFQEIVVGCDGERLEIGKRELVSVTPELEVTTERL